MSQSRSDEVDFLHADKHLNFLQINTTFFTVFMCLARPVSSTQKNLKYLCDISRTKLGMQLIFSMQGNIKVFKKLILSFLNGVASLSKIPKITSLQYLTNDMLYYLDFRYVYRPPNQESNPLHKHQSKTIANDNCTNIILVIIFNKKEGVKVDLQNMRKQGAEVEELIFNFVDSLVKMICKMPKSQLLFSDWLIFCPR